ncbi:hypothetical protein [Streptomyces sp. 1331.2]|uniref:hypothetical protein n=1 Tax=Streptomyces sp. 1331.2 TaxID=1938835 RepID=UPI000BD75B48|nr:hypothetical protein [Streptomyces sp. 1331.2]SOB88817.1 hypothetical protein SAMN06272789_7132 [Streptomyces sp. 1331.2]
MSWSRKLTLAASALALTTALAATVAAPAQAGAQRAAATTVAQPGITSVAFSGTAGPWVASPTVTITGSGFGATPPPGAPNNATSCGTYSANGYAYGSQLYFTDDNDFEAGYSSSSGANCIGITVVSWSANQVVLQFGNAYGTFAHWYLSNGDGYALSINNGIFGGTVQGLH